MMGFSRLQCLAQGHFNMQDAGFGMEQTTMSTPLLQACVTPFKLWTCGVNVTLSDLH